MLHRLVGRPVLSHPDGVVGHDVDDPGPHQGTQADGGPGIVREDQEGAREGDHPAVQGHAVHGRSHAVLAHAPVDIAAGIVRDVEGSRALDEGVIRPRQVGGAADHFRDGREQVVQGRAGMLAGGGGGPGLHSGGDVGVEGGEGVGGQVAGDGALEVRSFHRASQSRLPGLASPHAPAARPAPGPDQVVRQLKRGQVPAHGLAGLGDLGVEQGVAVAVGIALLGARTLRDVRAAGDQGRTILLHRPAQGGSDPAVVMAIHGLHGPAIGLEPGQLVARLGDGRDTVDGGVVVVEEDGQPVQAEAPGDGGSLVAHALHQAAVPGDDPGAVIDEVLAEPGGQVAFGHGHAHGGGKALAEGTGGGLHPWRMAELRVAGSPGAPLPEVPDLVHRDGLVAGQVQQGVEQHGAVPGGKDKAIPVRPVRTGGVELQELGPEHGGDVRHTHGHALVAGFRPVHRIHGKDADGIGHFDGRDRHGGNPVGGGKEVGPRTGDRKGQET